MLAAGSDETRQTSTAEIDHLRGLGVLSNVALLDVWGAACASMLFPKRKLGKLRPGYEASFLALGADPLVDFAATPIESPIWTGCVSVLHSISPIMP